MASILVLFLEPGRDGLMEFLTAFRTFTDSKLMALLYHHDLIIQFVLVDGFPCSYRISTADGQDSGL